MGKANSYRALKTTWIALRILGLDPPERYKTLYQVYSVFLNFTVTFYYPFSMFINMFLLDTKKEVVSNLTLTLCVLICSIKMFNNFTKQKELRKIREYLTKLDADVKVVADEEYLEYIVKVSFQYFALYASMYGLVAATCELPVMFAPERRLLYPAWFPWDWKKSTRTYIVLHLYQLIGICIQIYQNLLNDTFPGILMWLLKGHLHVLKSRIERLGYDRNLSADENYNELVACIERHKLCLEFRKLCENLISSVLVIQFICTEVTLCMTAIYIFFVGDNLMEVVYLSCYFISMILEITLCCYCGSEMVEESYHFTTGLYQCNWMDQNLKFRKVLKSAYSLFAVLNRVA
ncbi:odorant receptor 2a-like isoform X2 [Hermetia illucens]|uniref:odorant receptor 2a-like isoform X2 n=1 Tax=Hermetia illucens TaxID=343691 RepID=UPI0018CBFB36|nr:odorant receptor 2a-like isoform X2 [Hermetia illucens]